MSKAGNRVIVSPNPDGNVTLNHLADRTSLRIKRDTLKELVAEGLLKPV